MQLQQIYKNPNIDPDAFERKWKDRYKGERCAILMDGPSLPDAETLEQIDCVVIGTNRSYQRRQPDIYVIVDPRLTREIGYDIAAETPEAVLRMSAYKIPHAITPNTFIWRNSAKHQNFHFSTDIARKGWVLCCVMPCAVQLAYYLGFREIVFCGLDLNFDEGLHFYEGGRSSQFYMDAQLEWLRLAKPAMEERGLTFVNTSLRSAEKLFPKVPFDEVFPCR